MEGSHQVSHSHPYEPKDLQLPGFVPLFLSQSTILAVYGFSSLLVVSFIWIFSVNAHHLSLPPFPRKLLNTEKQVKEYEARHAASHKNHKANLSGEKQERDEKMVIMGKKGTRQEWVEGEDPTQYFTMDYSGVRRRRPIHNKNIPVAP